MPVTTGYFATENASKYLQQLCKHFAHKITATCDETKGRAEFIFGTAEMSADESGLTIRFDLEDAQAVPAAHGVIDSHLQRFAFREDFQSMDWTTS